MKAAIYPVKAATDHRIAIVARPRGGDWLNEEVGALKNEGIDVLVSMLTEGESKELGLGREREECETVGIRFMNLATADRSVPSDAKNFLRTVHELAELVKEGHFVGVHCRAGIGRSSLLVASVLLQLGWRAADAFAAIESARGCVVPDTPEQRQWVIQNVWVHRS